MAWDRTKPAASDPLQSGPVRANFQALETVLGAENLCPDPNFLIWPAETSAGTAQSTPPAHWSISGTGATVKRCGSGLTDTTEFGLGGFAALLAYSSSTARLYQSPFPSALPTHFRSKTFSFAAVVKASASGSRLFIDDGVGTTTTAHAGDGNSTWLSVTRTLDGSATKLEFGLEATSGSAYIEGGVFLVGSVPAVGYVPARTSYGMLYFPIVGNLGTGTKKAVWAPARPGIVRYVQLRCETAPVSQAWIVDVNTWDGSAFTSMFSTRPQVAAAANQGGASPDTTYARRCLNGLSGSTLAAGKLLSYDVDQVGSGTTGADGIVEIRVMQFADPFEEWRTT